MIVQKEAEPKQPRRAQSFVIGQHEAQGPDDVRRHPPQDFAFHKRFAHQTEFQMFEIAQSAVDQLGCRR
jgi:hypothetical protein